VTNTNVLDINRSVLLHMAPKVKQHLVEAYKRTFGNDVWTGMEKYIAPNEMNQKSATQVEHENAVEKEVNEDLKAVYEAYGMKVEDIIKTDAREGMKCGFDLKELAACEMMGYEQLKGNAHRKKRPLKWFRAVDVPGHIQDMIASRASKGAKRK
jgi:hypothetical protein